MDLPIDEHLTIFARELRYTFARSGGPGGQHVNTTDTRVRLHFKVASSPSLPPGVRKRMLEALANRINAEGELILTSDRYRSRHRNTEDVRDRLKALVLQHRRAPKKRRATRPTRASQKRRVDAKKRRSQVKAGRKKVDHD